MKCSRYAIYGWKSKQTMMKKPPLVIGNLPEKKEEQLLKLGFRFFSHLEICGGEIISQIELEFIPYMGGSDANVEVRFRCKKCGHEHAGDNGLPYDLNSLNEFLTKIIGGLD